MQSVSPCADYMGYDKEINHDLLMNNPYGDVLSRRRAQEQRSSTSTSRGATFRSTPRPYAHRTRQLKDWESVPTTGTAAALPSTGGGEIFGLP